MTQIGRETVTKMMSVSMQVFQQAPGSLLVKASSTKGADPGNFNKLAGLSCVIFRAISSYTISRALESGNFK